MSALCRLSTSSHPFWSGGVAWVGVNCVSSLTTLIKNMLQLGSTEITLWCTLLHVIAWSCLTVYFGIICGWSVSTCLAFLVLFLLHLDNLRMCCLFAHIHAHTGLSPLCVCLNRCAVILCIFVVYCIHRFSVAQKTNEINLSFGWQYVDNPVHCISIWEDLLCGKEASSS